MVRAFVAVARQLGEALVDERQPSFDFGEHGLRSALLLRNAAGKSVKRRTRPIDMGAKRSSGFDSGGTDARRGLLDKGSHSRGLRVDSRTDFVECRRRGLEKRRQCSGKARFGLADTRGGGGSRAFDFGKP